MNDAMHTIKYVVKNTGLSAHTIRAWERRYAVLLPARTASNRRLYSSEDVQKLDLLRRVTEAGCTISRVAGLSIDQLNEIANTQEPASQDAIAVNLEESRDPLAACLAAVQEMDLAVLDEVLSRSGAVLGHQRVIDEIIVPLLHVTGDLWAHGQIRAANEHMASAVIRSYLGEIIASYQAPENARTIIVTTPAGQLHEFGALVAAVSATSSGWKPIYLGPNLPAEEIAGAAIKLRAAAVALSIIFPCDDPRLLTEIPKIRKLLPSTVRVYAGGQASEQVSRAFAVNGVLWVPNMTDFRKSLAG